MKRIAIFAHYDKHCIIDSYVIDYIKELKKYSEIIFVSDGDLTELEKEKIKYLCLDIVATRHYEYDFGSYKRGFQLIQNRYPQKFKEINELIFVNDSCYLIGSFKNIFADMEKKLNCDFWGLADDIYSYDKPEYHIQSYFLSFRKSVFLDNIFHNFIHNIKRQNLKNKVIYYYEIGLSQMLIKNNKKSFCYFPRELIAKFIKKESAINTEIKNIFARHTNLKDALIAQYLKNIYRIDVLNYTHSDKFYFYIRNGFPLIKRKIIIYDDKCSDRLLFLWQEILKETNAKEIKKIKDHLSRIGERFKTKNHIKSTFNTTLLNIKNNLNLFYIKRYIKDNKKVVSIKFLFFKIKFYNLHLRNLPLLRVTLCFVKLYKAKHNK